MVSTSNNNDINNNPSSSLLSSSSHVNNMEFPDSLYHDYYFYYNLTPLLQESLLLDHPVGEV